jgi:hypothetical protein
VALSVKKLMVERDRRPWEVADQQVDQPLVRHHPRHPPLGEPGAGLVGGRRLRAAVARVMSSSRRIGSGSPTGNGTSMIPTRLPPACLAAASRIEVATEA